MSVLSFPRIYFKGFIGWDPCTFNNNDFTAFQTFDATNAALNWSFLEGLPNLQDLGKLLIGEHVEECLQGDLTYERDIQRPLLVQAIALCETAGDYVSRELLEDLLEHCEEAIDWLETQHSLIDNVTLPNYLQAHMEPGGD